MHIMAKFKSIFYIYLYFFFFNLTTKKFFLHNFTLYKILELNFFIILFKNRESSTRKKIEKFGNNLIKCQYKGLRNCRENTAKMRKIINFE